MTHFLLIRTGNTDYDLQRRVQGTINLPLCDEGQQRVEQVAGELAGRKLDALYAGPGQATQQTAELVARRLSLKVKTRKQLHNLDLGLWQGMLVDDVKQKQPRVYRQWLEHPETVCPPEGETVKQALLRLQENVDKIAKKHKDETVAMVLAEPLASLFCHLMKNCCMGDLWQAHPQNRPDWELVTLSPPLTVAETHNGFTASQPEPA